MHFPLSVPVASAGGRTHKPIFPRQNELAAIAKAILGSFTSKPGQGPSRALPGPSPQLLLDLTP